MVASKYEKEGWGVLRGGAPDFLMVKFEDNELKAILAVEVKSPDSTLTYEQEVYRKVMERFGIPYTVEVIE